MTVIMLNTNEKNLEESYSIKKNRKIEKKFCPPERPPASPQGTPISRLGDGNSKIARVARNWTT